MPVNDPWYTRTEFWTMVGAILQSPLVMMIPTVGPAIQIASAVLVALAPVAYIHGRGKVKASASALLAAQRALQAK